MTDVLTDTQLRLFNAIKEHEVTYGSFCAFPTGIQLGACNLYDKSGARLIYSNFKQDTFRELIRLGLLVQTAFEGYRIADGYGGKYECGKW